MKTLQLKLETARKLYPTAAPEFRQMLEETFGKKALKQSVIDRIKTYEDACRELGIEDPSITFSGSISEEETLSTIAYIQLRRITEALNEGWKPDWENEDELKYYPWFNMNSSAAPGFSFDGYGCDDVLSSVAARLCFKSRELAEYAGKQFEDIYREFMTL